MSSIKLHVDWRQVQRWGINPRAVPGDAVVHFRKPPFHEAYRKEVLAAAGVFALQAGLIGGLLWQRRRRRLAETLAARHRFELVHASRVAVAGELAGAIAHEINQPLAAILSNAEAADIALESGRATPGLLRSIVADIRRDDVRASEVIRRLRALLQKQRVEPQRLDLNEVLTDMGLVVLPEARRRGVWLDLRPAPVPAATFGDRIQLQQVVINLVLNAMEAMAGVAEERRRVDVGVAVEPATVTITVRDNGPGIPSQMLEQVFESFFTTKPSGMGLGLSIVRTIVEAHGGRIQAGNGLDGGAVFHIDLPAMPASGPGTQEGA